MRRRLDRRSGAVAGGFTHRRREAKERRGERFSMQAAGGIEDPPPPPLVALLGHLSPRRYGDRAPRFFSLMRNDADCERRDYFFCSPFFAEWRSMPITTAQLLQARDKQRDVRCRITGPCAAARPPHSLLPHLGLRGKSKNVIASICSIPSARCGAFVA